MTRLIPFIAAIVALASCAQTPQEREAAHQNRRICAEGENAKDPMCLKASQDYGRAPGQGSGSSGAGTGTGASGATCPEGSTDCPSGMTISTLLPGGSALSAEEIAAKMRAQTGNPNIQPGCPAGATDCPASGGTMIKTMSSGEGTEPETNGGTEGSEGGNAGGGPTGLPGSIPPPGGEGSSFTGVVRLANTMKCWTGAGNDSPIGVGDCSPTNAAQEFRGEIDPQGERVQIHSTADDLCIEHSGGTNLTLAKCNDEAEQKFAIEEEDAGFGLRSSSADKCITASETQIFLSDCTSNDAQVFQPSQVNSGN